MCIRDRSSWGACVVERDIFDTARPTFDACVVEDDIFCSSFSRLLRPCPKGWVKEDLTPFIDGTNMVFPVSFEADPDSLLAFTNGLLETCANIYADAENPLKSVTLPFALKPGDRLWVRYRTII